MTEYGESSEHKVHIGVVRVLVVFPMIVVVIFICIEYPLSQVLHAVLFVPMVPDVTVLVPSGQLVHAPPILRVALPLLEYLPWGHLEQTMAPFISSTAVPSASVLVPSGQATHEATLELAVLYP